MEVDAVWVPVALAIVALPSALLTIWVLRRPKVQVDVTATATETQIAAKRAELDLELIERRAISEERRQQFELMRDEVSHLRAENQRLREDTDTKVAKVREELEGRIGHLQDELGAFQTRYYSAMTEMLKLAGERDKLLMRVSDLEVQVATLRARLDGGRRAEDRGE